MQGNVLSHFIKEAFRLRDSRGPVHVVLGNESCDLDSAVSALCYGALLRSESPGPGDTVILPVLNIPREDFPLRTEVNFLFRECQLPCEELIFRDSLDLLALRGAGALSLTLVDHHVLPGRDAALADCLVEVLDHRPRDPAQQFPAVCRVDLRPAGSCAALVAERLLARAPHLLDKQAATLIAGTVLLDTACFSPEADRTTALDVAAVEACESRCGMAPADRAATFRRLVDARGDVSGLTALQLLRKDMKLVSGLPMPGMPLLVKAFLPRPDAQSALSALCAKHGSPAVVVMGMCFSTGQLRRDLFVYSEGTPELANKLVEALENSETLSAKRVACDVPGGVLFEQANVKASRKQVLPIVKAVVEKHAGKGS